MKKKVVFDKPADVVGIQDISSDGIFVAEKNGFQAILSGDNKWLDIEGLTLVKHITGVNKEDSLTQASDEGCTIYQYPSFWEFCKEYSK